MRHRLIRRLIITSKNWPLFIRRIIYRLAKYRKVEIKRNVLFDSYQNIHLDTNVFVNYNVEFYTSGKAHIYIGKNVNIGPNVHFCCATHEKGTQNCRAGEGKYLDITVGDGSWICMDCVVIPGITIGPGSIIAAGSIVTKNIPANELWGGIPAKKIKELK